MTMMSFAITLYGQCCRCHVVDQPVVSDISIVAPVEVFLCSESNNTKPLLGLLTAVLGTSILLHTINIT